MSTDGPASVALAEQPGALTLAVSDPSRTAASVTVTLPELSARAVTAADPSVEVVSLHPLTVRAATGDSRGASHRITLSR